MEIIKYPLLSFQIKDDAVLGILIGTGLNVIEKDIDSVKSMLGSYLYKEYKKRGDYPFFDLEKPRLKVIHVPVRPAYQADDTSYPLSTTYQVPVPIIYGPKGYEGFQCFLPLVHRSFSYYRSDQLITLAKHFATHILNQLEPEKIFRMMTYSNPQLDEVTLKVNLDREPNWGAFNYERAYTVLPKLAEQYPNPQQTKKRKSPFPDAAWERDAEVSDLVNELISSRANVLLVGDSGAGKSTVLRAAIRKIKNRGNKQKLDFSFWNMLPDRITSSAKYLGDWQETCEILIEELSVENGILWVENIMQLISSGGESAESSVAAFFLPFMQQRKLQIIGEVTVRELDKMRQLLPGFVQSFKTVHINDLEENQVHKILANFAGHCSTRLGVEMDQDALSLSFRLLKRYIPYEQFPGKGIKFLSKCVNEVLHDQGKLVDTKVVIKQFIDQTGLPPLFLQDEILLDVEALGQYFSTRIIGQEDAIEKLTSLVKIFKARLNDPRKPIQTLLFAGPTGVGKTASAKVLAGYFFGQGQKNQPLIRIDMSEFQHPGQLARLVGAGKEVGQLVKEVREKPFAVLLFDEIEKAHPSVFDALLTLLDEGLLVDTYGRVTNFRNTIIIMASNVGASERTLMAFNQTTTDESKYQSAIAKFFKPEFINRIDSVVLFQPLDKASILKITLKELEELKTRDGFIKRNVTLQFSDKLVNHLAEVGFDERLGARPLQRAIEQVLVSPLAKWMLDNPAVSSCKLEADFNKVLKVSVLRS
jgi:ATP-dependent Clp protease ATP-binding subunit ClpA